LVSVLTNVTVAPGITAPEGSVTVPVSAPVPADWADSDGVSASSPAITAKTASRETDSFIVAI
jgi:hypothetical protein